MRVAHSLPPAIACLAAAALPAQVTVTADPASTVPGGEVTLTAVLAGHEGQPEWLWSLPEPDSGSLTPLPGGRCRYTAPDDFLLRPRPVTVRVAPGHAPALAAELTLPVDPGKLGLVFGTLLADSGYLPCPDPTEPSLSLLAGDPEHMGSVAGTATQARFNSLRRLAWTGDHPDPDLAGQWLVLDRGAHLIRVMDAAGTVRPWAGDGTRGQGDGPGLQARFSMPSGLSVRPRGTGPWRAVVADHANHVIRMVDGKGQISTLAGMPGSRGFQDGGAAKARFAGPMDAVIGSDGAVYVADSGNHRIRRIQDGVVSTLAGNGEAVSSDGQGTQAGISHPSAITQDPRTGHLYVVDSLRCLRRVALDGTVTTLAGGRGTGFEAWLGGPALPPGPERMAGVPCLNFACGLTVHRGRLYIADAGNHALRVLDLATGELTTLAGDPTQRAFRPGRLRAGRALAPATCAALPSPFHVAFDDQGHALVAVNGQGTFIAELAMAGLLDEAKDTPPAP